MSEERRKDDGELRRLRSAVAAQERDSHERDDLEHRQDALITRLRGEAAVREEDLVLLRERLETAEHELEDLRAIRDALTPPELPRRPGLELAAAFLPAVAERVSGDFYLVAEGHGAGRRRCRRPRFGGRAPCIVYPDHIRRDRPFSDDPSRLLSWANTALIERAGTSVEFVTAACVTFLRARS